MTEKAKPAKLLTADLLRRPAKRVIVECRVPDDFHDPDIAGSTFYVRRMKAGERGRYEMQFKNSKSGQLISGRAAEIRERIIIQTLCDKEGNLLLGKDDLQQLKQMDSVLADLIVTKAQEVNQVSEEDLEELAGN